MDGQTAGQNLILVPKYPQVPPLGHDPSDRIKNPSDMFCIFHTQSLE